MTWFSEVLHIAKKDARESRLPVIVFACATLGVLFTVSMNGMRDLTDLGMFLLLLWGTAFAMVALLVQNDAVASVAAMWTRWPIKPSAMCVAKLLMVVVAILAPLVICQVVLLITHGVVPSKIPSYLVESVSPTFIAFSAILLISVLTPNFQTFILAAILSIVAESVGDAVGGSINQKLLLHLWMWRDPIILAWAFITVAAGIFCYFVKDLNSRMFLALFISANALLHTAVGEPSVTSVVAAPSESPQRPGHDVPMQISGVEFRNLEKNAAIAIEARAELNSVMPHIELVHATIAIADSNGKSELIVPPGLIRWEFKRLSAVPGAAGKPAGSDTVRAEFVTQLSAKAILLARELGHGARITVTGQANVFAGQVIGTLPLAVGASFQSEEKHFAITSLRATESNRWEIRSESMLHGDEEGHRFLLGDTVEFGLLNYARKETVGLNSINKFISDRLTMLPGPVLAQLQYTFDKSQLQYDAPIPRIDDAWMHDARIAVILWRRTDSYPVRLEYTMP